MTHPIIMATTAILTMSSLEIAKLTGKRHDNVMADIRKMLVELHSEGGVLSFQGTHNNPQNGQTYPVFDLPKRESLILVSGYHIKTRAAIIDRWQELEEQVAKPALNPADLSRLQLIELAMQAEQERLQLEHKVEELVPKASALDRIATHSEGSFCIRDAAKTLQVQEKHLRQLMYEKDWIYRRPMGMGWLAYADKLQQGLMEHKMARGQKNDGTEWTDTQARVTAKGMTRLAALLSALEATV